ncbi:hypothetical protein pb186bvf_006334 [Paramecium bursaria]
MKNIKSMTLKTKDIKGTTTINLLQLTKSAADLIIAVDNLILLQKQITRMTVTIAIIQQINAVIRYPLIEYPIQDYANQYYVYEQYPNNVVSTIIAIMMPQITVDLMIVITKAKLTNIIMAILAAQISVNNYQMKPILNPGYIYLYIDLSVGTHTLLSTELLLILYILLNRIFVLSCNPQPQNSFSRPRWLNDVVELRIYLFIKQDMISHIQFKIIGMDCQLIYSTSPQKFDIEIYYLKSESYPLVTLSKFPILQLQIKIPINPQKYPRKMKRHIKLLHDLKLLSIGPLLSLNVCSFPSSIYMFYLLLIGVLGFTDLSLDSIIQPLLIKYIEDNALECQHIELLVDRGFGQQILDAIQNDLIILENQIICARNAINEDLKRLNQLKRSIQGQEDDYFSLEPVIQWAQSKSHLLIKVKFAHRIDAPAYLNVKNHEVVCDGKELSVKADSLLQNKQALFFKNIIFFKEVNQNVEWKLESVGTMVMNVTKIQPELWIQLSNNSDKYLIWWDMKKQIGADMEEFSRMLERKEDQKNQKKPSKPKEPKPKKSKGILDSVINYFNN